MAKRKKDFSTAITSFTILLVVIVVVGFLAIFTDNFSSDLKCFYVKYGSDTIIDDRENFSMLLNREYEFEVENTMTENNGYIVKIIPNEVQNFTFQVDGVDKQYKDLSSLAKGFTIIADEDGFKITATMDLPKILQLYHNNNTLTNVPSALNTGKPYFRLVIMTSDFSEEININFNIKSE